MSDYIVVLTRAVPVESGQDTSLLEVSGNDTVDVVMQWVDMQCQGQCFPIRVELLKPQQLVQSLRTVNNGEQEAPY